MLVNNFKMLITFVNSNTFKDVGGYDKTYAFLGGKNGYDTSSTDTGVNHHSLFGTLAYNYDPTPGSNSYVSEQTAYKYTGITNGSSSSSSATYPANRYTGLIIYVGTGETPVTANDYKLDTPISLSVVSASCIINSNNTVEVERTFQNNTENDVVIKEIGLYVFASQSNQQSQVLTLPILIGRKVLNEPVTILVGAAYTFNYSINMNNIIFSEADS